jgi:1-deoxy-D-xylulose-5-phosphate synthase
VTVEENTIVGGFGTGVLALLQEQGLLRPAAVVGLPAAFVTHGDLAGLYREIGFTSEVVAERALELVRTT